MRGNFKQFPINGALVVGAGPRRGEDEFLLSFYQPLEKRPAS